ncbi:hypothetical protein JDV02_008316 [Purpureocillium takamizusanense]|uniref:Zn(2)-C6 fungal-type domain-containing protein n=1 Tax=Purpureocillium takamizusanense TaxID=2060973 RepID=A0A9Q8QMN6_9HYPO|nr:uncharacterized protein JDV02_008316 [Purpureocillium takamizusanense]UNI22425.1 hypothetical protein JDV02_008316 [Purpureocillium takamizusanense]
MAEDRLRQDRTQHNHSEDKHQGPARYPPGPPPPSTDEHQQGRRSVEGPRSAMAATVTLPSIHEARGAAGYGPQGPPQPPPPPGARGGYPHDPRYASPNAVNGYPPPSAGQQPPPSTYLPPLQTGPADPRSPAYPPDQRGGYYDDRRPPPGQYPDPHQAQQYAAEGYYYRGPPGVVPPNGYPRPPQGPYQEYAPQPGGAPGMAQAAPRQRTSIACRYCRKRKIRCSGYQNTPGGKCQNCARMNQECIFQPVSSSSSTAFIPVSAVPGGVPPGTQLFGAYGQPLAPSSMPVGHPYPPPHHGGPPPPGPAPPNYYSQHPPPGPHSAQPTQSPTESFSSYGDDAQVAGRRRRRTPEEREEGYRLPPPRGGAPDEEARRRSPAEFSNNSSPGNLTHLPYQGARQSPHNAAALPQAPGQGGRSPAAANGSSGASTPARQQQASSGQSQNSTSVMSLSNLVDKSDIDRGMIDRLNRQRDSKGANGSR